MSLLEPLSCGFAKAFVFTKLVEDKDKLGKNVNNSELASIYKMHHDAYSVNFSNGQFDVEYEHYKKNFVKIKDVILSLGKCSNNKKNNFLETFSSKSWKELKPNQRQKHSVYHCKGCLHNESLRIPLSYLPIKSKSTKRKAAEAGLFQVSAEKVREAIKEVNLKFTEENHVSLEKAMRVHLNRQDSEKRQNSEGS